ncbi:BNR repeat-containing protein, partial [Patescibacteria group bacterium]|nr:BNR repeat-containing protein [Patescibacteria group bacterium]
VMGPSDAAYLSDLVWDGSSWKSARPPIIQGNSGDNTYVGFMEYNNNKVHMTWTYAYSQGGRRNVFYAYLNLTDGNMYSINGRNLGTTIDTAEAETYCIVRNTGAGESNTPSMHFDSSGYPWIIYPEGSGTTWRFYHTRWDGSAWTAPEYITTTDDRFNYEDFKINSVTDVTAYLTTSGEPGPGGDIEQWHWNGAAWSKVSTLLSQSVSGKPLGGPNIPYNFNPELDLVFSQFLDDIFTDDTLKLYAVLETSSTTTTPTPTPTPTPFYVTPTLYCLGLDINSCITLTTKPSQIPTTPGIPKPTPTTPTPIINTPIIGGASLLILLISGIMIYYKKTRHESKT